MRQVETLKLRHTLGLLSLTELAARKRELEHQIEARAEQHLEDLKNQLLLIAHVHNISLREAALALEQHLYPKGELKELDYLIPEHPEVQALGMPAHVAKAIGAGYAPRGTMASRCLFPLRKPDGSLVGYVGINLTKDPIIDDNRIENLRMVDRATNQRNQINQQSKNTKSGVSGIRWEPRNKKWHVRLSVKGDGHRTSCGQYECLADAVTARNTIARIAGYIV